jgi:hypothetical protein
MIATARVRRWARRVTNADRFADVVIMYALLLLLLEWQHVKQNNKSKK